MAKRLFGTDGIRATANTFPMTPNIIMKVGQALGLLIRRDPPINKHPKVVIGKDTRLSGYMVELALTSGLNSMGVHVQLVGPLPTPGIGFLARNMRADAGIIISASHNPFHDNGIKIFGSDGFKISSEMEDEIETLVLDTDLEKHLAEGSQLGRTKRIDDAAGRYIVDIKNAFPLEYTLEGLRVVLDCAHGAAYKVAPAVFEELGAEVILLGNKPNGFNVNDKAGALYPASMTEAVVKYRADVGVSLDGDADRVIMADENGQVINGDHILAIAATHLKEQGRLPKNTIVSTHMSNFALDKLMKDHGIQVVRTDVGDKNVVEEMRRYGYTLGGEQSGHIIFLEHSTTGDGCVAALNILEVMKASGKKLSELASFMKEVPQILINTKIKSKKELNEIPGYSDLKSKIESDLKGEGRILVRYSGTENLARVLVEGPDKKHISNLAQEMASLLEKSLN
ncbi:MAG: phosphoglucosamine mutase [Pseudomonadota bacterium]